MQVSHIVRTGCSDGNNTSSGHDCEGRKVKSAKRILVPLDGSSLAEMALPHAIAFARATANGLLLMRVVPPINTIFPFAGLMSEVPEVWEIYDEQPAFAGHYLQEVVDRLAPMELEVETHVAQGAPADLIVEYAREHPEVTAIAMSTHGRSGIGSWLFGSVAEKVLNTASVPLLLIRPEGKHEVPSMIDVPSYKTVLVPLDGSAFAAQALDQAKSLGQSVGARLVLIAVASTPFDLKLVKLEAATDWSAMPWYTPAARMAHYLDSVIEPLSKSGMPIEAQITYGDIADEILKAAKYVEADLIVMATHGLGGLGHMILGSVATRVAQRAHIPLLLVRAKKQNEEGELVKVEQEAAIGATA